MKEICIEKATKACEVICSVIAPKDGSKLFQEIHQPTANVLVESTDDLIALMSAYRDDMTKNVKIEILNIYAYRYTMNLLQKFNEPYEKKSLRQIKRARLHARKRGPWVKCPESIQPSSTSAHKQSLPLYRFCKPSLFVPRRRLWNANTDLRWGRQNNNAQCKKHERGGPSVTQHCRKPSHSRAKENRFQLIKSRRDFGEKPIQLQ